MSKKSLCPKKCWVKKILVQKKLLGLKNPSNVCHKKFLGPNKFWVQKNLGPKNFGSKKFWVDKFWKKDLALKNVWDLPLKFGQN